MKYSVSFDYDWNDPKFQELRNLPADDARFDELSCDKRHEVEFANYILREDNLVPLEVLQKLAGIALEEAFETGFHDIIERWFSNKQLQRDIDDEIRNWRTQNNNMEE